MTWGSSAFESSSWMMGGTVQKVGDSIVVEYADCMRTDMVANEYGQIDQTTVYGNGKGTLTFTNGTVVWDDLEEHIADGAVFTYCD